LAVMGTPKKIKIDNGPAYTSRRFEQFLCHWGIEHTTGIPHSPTGQAIIERAHGT
ncbi:POK18 protein, partial [Malurus elegans]|nr:POK18 protein [Malurus elegans]